MNISLPGLNESEFDDIGDPTFSETECSDCPPDNGNMKFEMALTSYELWHMRKEYSRVEISSDSGDDDGNPHNDWPTRRRTQRKTIQSTTIPGLVVPSNNVFAPISCVSFLLAY